MWPSVVKIQFTELKLSCGNMCGRKPPVIPNHIIRPVSRRAYTKWVWFLLVLSYLWYGKPFSRSDGRLQFTVLQLSCWNDPVVKNSIYSNADDGDLALWPNDPKINRVLPLLRGNHVAKFGKDPIYRTKVMCGNLWKIGMVPVGPLISLIWQTLQQIWWKASIYSTLQGTHVCRIREGVTS